MHPFEMIRPATLDEAVAALAQEGTQALAGGQTLIPTMKAGLAAPERLVALTAIAGLCGIVTDGDGALCIGATTPHAQVAREAAAIYPALAGLAAGIGDRAVRSRGTIGGSIANNDPAADYPAAALASGAVIVTDRREIAADDFFDGLFTTVLDEGEIVTAVRFPVPRAAAYVKFPQPASRFALVGAFVARFPAGVRVAVTGAGADGVFRWKEAEAALGDDFTPGALAALDLPDAGGMLGDIHGSGEYRAHLVNVMTRRAVERCA